MISVALSSQRCRAAKVARADAAAESRPQSACNSLCCSEGLRAPGCFRQTLCECRSVTTYPLTMSSASATKLPIHQCACCMSHDMKVR